MVQSSLRNAYPGSTRKQAIKTPKKFKATAKDHVKLIEACIHEWLTEEITQAWERVKRMV